MKKVSPKKYSPKKRPSSPNRRPASPSKLATHLAPEPSWARSYVRGQYYDESINIVPNTKKATKGVVKHGAMNFFMGTGGKPSSLKTSSKHIGIDETGNLVFASKWSDKFGSLNKIPG